ncbi:MAG: hypothetical protein KF857_09985 [Fimbriimonadaceae bacterium]|nr:hypothetical protein [Fimbriimonadaceae bacterium]
MRDTFPEPYVVPGHVADAPYRVGLAFKRRTVMAWSATTVVSAVFVGRPLDLGAAQAGLGVLVVLILLTFVRRLVPHRGAESSVSALLCLGLQPFVGTLVASLGELGVDLRLVYIVPVTLVTYTLVAGRDFSHFGYAVLGSATALLAGGVAAWLQWLGPADAAFSIVLAVLATVYVACDLSMLMRRRLPGEELGATADLYRDTLNFITYSFRVAYYVRRYRFL